MGTVDVNAVLYLVSTIMCLIGALLMPQEPTAFRVCKLLFILAATICMLIAAISLGGLKAIFIN